MRPVCLLLLIFACFPPAPQTRAQSDPPRWYKGNLHTHSLWSDGDQFPEMIAQWYRDHGYNFLAMSDHNINGQDEKWVKVAEIKKRGAGDALEQYKTRYGDQVTLRGEGEAAVEVKLRPLDQYRGQIESSEFILIQAEELSDRFGQRPVHINATNIGATLKPAGGNSVREVVENNLRQIAEQSQRTGRPIMPHLNHPNFGWGVTPEDVAEIPEEKFFEVWNGHPQINYAGDKDHIDMERWWDLANAIRMTRLKARPLMGIATDDSHHYHVGGTTRSTSGRGWVVVRAAKLEPAALIRAMEAGDFYASSGIALNDVKYDPAKGEVSVAVAPEPGVTYVTRFVGCRKRDGAEKGGAFDPAGVSVVFAEVPGTGPAYRLTGNEMYVRAVVVADKKHANPTYEGQMIQAWTQPVGWERTIGGK